MFNAVLGVRAFSDKVLDQTADSESQVAKKSLTIHRNCGV